MPVRVGIRDIPLSTSYSCASTAHVRDECVDFNTYITILLYIRVKGTIGTVTGENKFHNFTFSFDTKRSPVTVQEMKLLFPVNIPSSDLEVLYAKGLNMTEQATGKHAIVGWLPGASFETNYKETLQL